MAISPSLRTTENTIELVAMLKELNGAGITELSNHTGLSKSTVYDHLSTLKKHDLVVKENNQYDIGLGFFEIGEYVRNRHKIYGIAKSQIESLAEQTGEVANLMIEEHGRGVYLYRAHGENAVTLDTHTGIRRYLHNTALGKAILAELPEDRVKTILDTHGLPKATDFTITNREELFNELERIRSRGYAMCGEERVKGLHCVAAPITSNTGRVLGSVSVASPRARVENKQLEDELPQIVTEAASIIEINVTYS